MGESGLVTSAPPPPGGRDIIFYTADIKTPSAYQDYFIRYSARESCGLPIKADRQADRSYAHYKKKTILGHFSAFRIDKLQ